MEKIKIVFVGTGDIGGELLKSLHRDDRFDVLTVITNRDKPAGRKMELQPSPIKVIAEKLELPIFQPEDINEQKTIDLLRGLYADFIVLMAYGQILSKDILEIATRGCLNVHASLLPKYRGASPVQNAILNQDKETGVCLMKMEKTMDTGAVYECFTTKIYDSDNQQTLTEKLAELAAKTIPGALVRVYDGRLEAKEQNEERAIYVKKITKERGAIDWHADVFGIDAKIRAYYGWPGTFTFFHGKRLKIISAQPIKAVHHNKTGLVTPEGVSCIGGYIMPKEVQMEGKNVQSYKGFLNGNPDFVGTVL
jgi:methionyl-tRNA formyltransferase